MRGANLIHGLVVGELQERVLTEDQQASVTNIIILLNEWQEKAISVKLSNKISVLTNTGTADFVKTEF